MKNNSTRMSRYAVLGLAALVVTVLVALVWNLRGDVSESSGGTERSESADQSAGHRGAVTGSRQDPRAPGEPLRTPGDSPPSGGEPSGGERSDDSATRAPGQSGDTAAPEGEEVGEETGVREYRRPDGVVVRDHRAGDHSVDLTRSIPRAPGFAKLQPKTVLQVHNALRPDVDGCAAELSQSGFGDRPEVRVDVIVEVAGENLTVERATVLTRDIPEDASKSLSDCIQGPAERLVIAAPGEDDLSSYTLTLPFQLRRR